MRHVILVATVLSLACAGTAGAGGFAVTYPPDSDNLSLYVGTPENVEVHLTNGLGMEVAVGISDNAGSVVSVSYPACFIMQPGEKEVFNLEVVPRSAGSFDVAVHVEVRVPEEQGGPMGGQVVGGMDIPLRGSVSTAQPTQGGFPWFYAAILVIAITGGVAYAIKRWWIR